ncbi:MAG: AMP-binding protein, partial [Gemmatimonadaceae bacterium]|nr:AMP-binding protein [Gemmatimonadaceae bacterium]
MPHIVHSALAFGDRPAVDDATGTTSYATLHTRAMALATLLLDGADDLLEARVAVLVAPGADWVTAMWGAWSAGAIAVPLSPQHPPAEWAYALDDGQVGAILVDEAHAAMIAPLAAERNLRVISVRAEPAAIAATPRIGPDRRAIMLYTSGTTGKPKGVVHTHGSLAAQVSALVEAWEWRATDHTLLVLPLHHVHGIVNVTCCALAVGARLTMHARFDATSTWAIIEHGTLTCFHAVPTIWARLLAAYDEADAATQARRRQAIA